MIKYNKQYSFDAKNEIHKNSEVNHYSESFGWQWKNSLKLK